MSCNFEADLQPTTLEPWREAHYHRYVLGMQMIHKLPCSLGCCRNRQPEYSLQPEEFIWHSTCSEAPPSVLIDKYKSLVQ